MPVVSVRIRTGPKKQQYAMIVHLAMTLSTVQGCRLALAVAAESTASEPAAAQPTAAQPTAASEPSSAVALAATASAVTAAPLRVGVVS